MRRDTTPDNGRSLELRIWLITLFVLAVSALLQYATTSHQYGKEGASGTVHSRHYVHTVMPLKAVKRGIRRGKGVRKSESKGCISLPPSFVRFYNMKVKGNARF